MNNSLSSIQRAWVKLYNPTHVGNIDGHNYYLNDLGELILLDKYGRISKSEFETMDEAYADAAAEAAAAEAARQPTAEWY